VVGRATSVLARRRVAAFVAWGAVVGAYYVWRTALPDLSHWWDVALLVFPIIPGVLLGVLIALPLRTSRMLLPAGIALVVVAFVCHEAHYELAANFAKLWAPVFLGWWFLQWFENEWWVVIVAVLIPFVDTYSVFWGPTQSITQHHVEVYFGVAFAFVVPNHSGAQVGPPDLLFFALFLAAAARFRLRPVATWAAMSLLLGFTVVLANVLDVDGLPALPFESLGFLLANADLLWRRRPRRALH
jgi:hypothetical protein